MPKIKVKGQTVQTGHTRTHTDATNHIISPATPWIITIKLCLSYT